MKDSPDTTSLGAYTGERRNNFTTIRLLFAWLVLWGHSFGLQPVKGVRDPFNMLLQGSTWVGELAVNGFFVISGYLVAASLTRRSIADYSLSRLLRIYPALVVCVVLSVLVLGPAVTTATLGGYFSDPDTWEYLQNALAILPMQWDLPSVFEDNKRSAVNGSLWTLTVEVRCYILLAIAGALGLLRHRAIFNLLAIGLVLFSFNHFADVPLIGIREKWSRLGLYFLVGVAFYVNREDAVLTPRLALAALLLFSFALGKDWYNYVAPLPLAYLIFYAAYRTPYLDLDGRFGDISYGLYIYAWPSQQVVAQYLPGVGPYGNAVLATALAVPLAYFSWRMIEAPALAQKKRLLGSPGSVHDPREAVSGTGCRIRALLSRRTGPSKRDGAGPADRT